MKFTGTDGVYEIFFTNKKNAQLGDSDFDPWDHGL